MKKLVISALALTSASIFSQEKKDSLSTKKIEEVSVTGRKKIFEKKVDRTVFNVENSVASQGMDAVEALKKTPMVRATDDALSIAGKNSVQVMVNDRLLNLSGQELINYLKTLRSDDIAKIEVITTPPAKYDANGKSGLINIVLKKNVNLGWNGTLQLAGTAGKYFSYRDGASANYQGKNLSFSGNASIGEQKWENSNYRRNWFADGGYWNSSAKNLGRYNYKSINLKSEYKISDNSIVGIGYNFSNSGPKTFSVSKTERKINNMLTQFGSDVENRETTDRHYANAFYEVKIDTAGSKLNISANYMQNRPTIQNLTNTYSAATFTTKSYPRNEYKIWNIQADLEKTFGKVKTEAGLKYSDIGNNSSQQFYNIISGEETWDAARSNDFDYNEKNYAAYAGAAFKLSEKWDSKIGLRYEYTDAKGFSPQMARETVIRYGKFFPSAYLSYKPGDNHTFNLNYSRRIDRPYFGSLNPFRTYSSEYEYSSGNPYLQPGFTDNLELGYVFKNNLTATLYLSHLTNGMDGIHRVQGDTKYSVPENFYDENRAGLSVNYNLTKIKWLESNLSANAFYAKAKSFIPEVPTGLAGYGASLSADNNFFLNKAKTVTFVLGAWYDTANRQGNTKYDGAGMVYTGMKLNLMDKKLLLNATLNDVFNTLQFKGTEYYSGFYSQYRYKGTNQNLNLSLTYKFGNNNVKGATKQVKFDEQNRAGGGGSK